MTMGDELLLLAVGTGRRHPRIRSESRLRIALGASELAELCLAGRISFGARRIEILDSRSVEDRRLNNTLRSLRTTTPPPGLHDWLRLTPRSLTTEYLSRLEDQKALRSRRWRDPAGRTRHDILSVDLPRRRTVLDRLDSVARSGPEAPAAHPDLVLAALVRIAGVASAAYPGLRGSAARRRLAARTTTGALPLAGSAGPGPADEKLAGTLVTRPVLPAGQLVSELCNLYSDVTTGGHGLSHNLDAGSWSEGGTGHQGEGSDN
jgi:hypothetical protein